MAVQPHRTSWNDERLDDLNQMIQDSLERTERDLQNFRAQVEGRFEQVDHRFDRVDDRFDRIDDRFDHLHERFDGLQRAMIVSLVGLSGALLSVLVAALAKLG